ncbi:MAG: oligosaccharide flippase family protein [Thermoleophilaceae bacterium]|nr:oligosaccharide flippase family protein [Thermoleophilaceae bacterium]
MEAGIESARRPGRRAMIQQLAGSDTGRAAGMGAAVIAVNVIALVFTVVFARILGASGYGSLAALISAFIILMVAGSSLQIATAREVSHAVADRDQHAGAGVRRWLRQLALASILVAVVAIPFRDLLGAAINVDEVWAAAAVPFTAMMWAIVCVERGALQGFQSYRLIAFSMVGEAMARLFFGLLLYAIGLGVTGAFLGQAAALITVALVLGAPLGRRLPHASAPAKRLRDLLAGSWLPMAALTLLFVLQEIHVIVVKHEVSGDAAGSYAVAAVAAKAIIWVAIGLGLYLLPETARRAKLGEDARSILVRTLALIGVTSVPMVLIYAAGAEPLLGAVFGDDLTEASGALPWLGLAMTLLACSYLSVQYMLAIGRPTFLWVLAPAAVAEVAVLVIVGADLTSVAIALFGLQLICAALMLILSLRRPPERERVGTYIPA